MRTYDEATYHRKAKSRANVIIFHSPVLRDTAVQNEWYNKLTSYLRNVMSINFNTMAVEITYFRKRVECEIKDKIGQEKTSSGCFSEMGEGRKARQVFEI